MQYYSGYLFKPSIGPSSSHTAGPMRAARTFVEQMKTGGCLDAVARVRVELFGSLAATGAGHGTDRAVLLGLEGCEPESVEPVHAQGVWDRVARDPRITLSAGPAIAFETARDLVFDRRHVLPRHPNGMRFTAFDPVGGTLASQTAYSIGLLYQRNASLSGADVGCQGEVGVACSMAAGALTEYLGGTPEQVEMAAEIGMEHNLGLTCDPVGGLGVSYADC